MFTSLQYLHANMDAWSHKKREVTAYLENFCQDNTWEAIKIFLLILKFKIHDDLKKIQSN